MLSVCKLISRGAYRKKAFSHSLPLREQGSKCSAPDKIEVRQIVLCSTKCKVKGEHQEEHAWEAVGGAGERELEGGGGGGMAFVLARFSGCGCAMLGRSVSGRPALATMCSWWSTQVLHPHNHMEHA